MNVENLNRPVGITKGPGETIHEYTFISRDEQRLLKNGEYVYYELDGQDSGTIGNNGNGRSSLPAEFPPGPVSGGHPPQAVGFPPGAAFGERPRSGSPRRDGPGGTGRGAGGEDLPRRVLGRVMRRVPVQLYPDTFLSEPEVAPSQVAALVGYDSRASDLFELHVSIMGYYDDLLGTFVNPWIPPSSGTPIYLADDALLSAVLSRKMAGSVGSAAIGSLLTRRPDAVPVVLDVKEVVSTHLAIIASTGAGKSYLASVLIEELMRPHNKAAVLIVDPHGEYGTLQEIANRAEFGEPEPKDGPRGPRRARYRAQAKVYLHDSVKVRLNTLTVGDLRYLLPGLTDKQHHFLSRAYEAVTKGKPNHHWTAEELKTAVARVGNDKNEESGDESGNSTVAALSWKIDDRLGNNTMVFDPHTHLDLHEILAPGQCTILQLNEIDERDQQVIVATLLRRLYRARLDTEKGKVQPGDERHLPYPVFVLLEEAHHFAPHGGDVVTTGILKQTLAEGRKFGIGMGLISQRPGKLDPDVLSQCMTQCIMRIVNEVDQKSVATAVEGVGHDLLENLPALSKGQAIIAGAAVNTPIICRVRTRLTPHGGESKDAPAEWQRHFADDRVTARTRESAPILRNNDPIDIFKH